MVRIEGLSLRYKTKEGSLSAVENLDAEFGEGRVSALIGPSGCGKTSLVMAACGLLAPSSGRIYVRGEKLEGIRRETSVIFQDYGLLPWLTAEGNIELPLRLRKMGARERRERSGALVSELGLEGFARFFPSKLSGGMRQRVAVARALASEPDLLLMDEPFSSLDALTREKVQEAFLEIFLRRRMTVLLVTHSIEEAAFLGDSVFVMRGRHPGRIATEFRIERSDSAPRKDFRAEEAFFRAAGGLRAALGGES